jgi:type IV pilus biogenesis protein CpaD/CtpE
MDGRGRGIGSRLVVVTLTLTLTACASRAPISMEQGATPEPSRTQATITCVSKYTLTTVLAPFIAADALLLAIMTPVAYFVDKERTVQAWHEVGLVRPQCD